MYIPYDTSSHEQTGNIIYFTYFEEGNLVERKRNEEENASISSSIDESPTYNYSNGGYTSTNVIKEIWDRRKIHPDINTRNTRLKMCEHILKTKNEWKGA